MATSTDFLVTDVQVDMDTPKPGVLSLLKLLRPSWNADDVDISTLQGGYANTSMCCYLKTDVNKSDAMVLRCHRGIFEEHISRQKEFLVMQLARSCDCFTAILATFKNGLAYHYRPGHTLKMTEVLDPKVIRCVAQKLACFHMLDVDQVPLKDTTGNPVSSFDKSSSFMQGLDGMVQKIPESATLDAEKNLRFQKHRMSKDTLVEELDFIKTTLHTMNPRLALTHCDFHFYNLVYDDATDEVTFLDFEVSEYRYQLLDLCQLFAQRHMIEDLGRISSDEPVFTEEARRMYLRCYLEKKFELQGKDPGTIDDLDFRFLDLEQQLLYPVFHLQWIIISQYIINEPNMELDLFAVVPRFKQIYYECKEKIPSLLSEYEEIKSKITESPAGK